MRWRDNPELWNEVLEVSKLPPEKIKHKSKYNDFCTLPEVKIKRTPIPRCIVEFDQKVVLERLEQKGWSLYRVADELKMSRNTVKDYFYRKRLRKNIIDIINQVCEEEMITVIGDPPSKQRVSQKLQYQCDPVYIKKVMREKCIARERMGFELGCSPSYYYELINSGMMKPEQAKKINEVLGEEVVRMVDG